jgi:hypothetical protein
MALLETNMERAKTKTKNALRSEATIPICLFMTTILSWISYDSRIEIRHGECASDGVSHKQGERQVHQKVKDGRRGDVVICPVKDGKDKVVEKRQHEVRTSEPDEIDQSEL